MKTYMIIALCMAHVLNGMETPNHQSITTISCEWNADFYNHDYPPEAVAYQQFLQSYSFKNATVFNWDDHCESVTKHLEQTALTVHTDKNKITSSECDIITAVQLPLFADELRYTLGEMIKRIKPSGELLGMIVTKTNDASWQQSSHDTFVTEAQKRNFNIEFFSPLNWEIIITDDEVKKQITEMRFDIISYTPKSYNIIIQNKPKLEYLHKCAWLYQLMDLKLSLATKKEMSALFAQLLVAQLKENSEKQLFYPYNVTEIHLRKTKHTS